MRHLCSKLHRTKTVDKSFLDTPLKRCLNTFDISLLGVGHMIGIGIYVLTGTAAHRLTGPGVVVSYVIAGIVSLFEALCYAEFGAWFPKAGSVYTYTYITVGELWAFVIGWSMILKYTIGAAAVARAWSGYFDSLFDFAISNGTMTYVDTFHKDTAERHFVAAYPDFIALLVIIIICIFICVGVKSSTHFNSIFTILNLVVIVFISIYGLTFAESSNWTSGTGFLPNDFAGVMTAFAMCFFAYIGFESIVIAGEETVKPARSIPLATFIAMAIVMVCNVLMSATITLMLPHNEIHPIAPFSNAFAQRGVVWAKYAVAIGALAGLTTSLFACLFALPRCVYAMASDGLIFRCLAFVSKKTHVPIVALGIFGLFSGLMALLIDFGTLIELLIMGNLLAYTIVSCGVIILRYSSGIKRVEVMELKHENDTVTLIGDQGGTLRPSFRWLKRYFATSPGTTICIVTFVMTGAMLLIGITIKYGHPEKMPWYTIWLLVIFGIAVMVCFMILCIHHQSSERLKFKVPLVPLIPAVSILINVVLMVHLSVWTWVRLLVWLAFGLLIYFAYGLRHSNENGNGTGEHSSLVSTNPNDPKSQCRSAFERWREQSRH